MLLKEPPYERHCIHERINRANSHDALDAGEVALDGERAEPSSVRFAWKWLRTADDDSGDFRLSLFRRVGPVILSDGIINGGELRAPGLIAHRDGWGQRFGTGLPRLKRFAHVSSDIERVEGLRVFASATAPTSVGLPRAVEFLPAACFDGDLVSLEAEQVVLKRNA